MVKMTALDRVLLFGTVFLSAYQIVVGIDGLSTVPIIAYTIAFGALLVATLLLIILGFDVLDSPVVVIVSTIIPLALSLGLVWEHLASYRTLYLIFTIVGFARCDINPHDPHAESRSNHYNCYRTWHRRHDHFPAPHRPRRAGNDESSIRIGGCRRRIDRYRWIVAFIPKSRKTDIIERNDIENFSRSAPVDNDLFCGRFQVWINTNGMANAIPFYFQQKESQMSTNSFFAKFLRFIGILLMALTGGFTLLGGIGTFCAAVFPQKYESMSGLIPYQWLYILFMLGTIAIGIWQIWAAIKLIKGTPDAYLMSIKALVAGVVVGWIPHLCLAHVARQIHACGCGGVHHALHACHFPALQNSHHLAGRGLCKSQSQRQ